jgi:hypothetical protein
MMVVMMGLKDRLASYLYPASMILIVGLGLILIRASLEWNAFSLLHEDDDCVVL